jgi:hypothetical protein
MTFWQFHCIAENFLMIRWRISNFKIFVFYLKFDRYWVLLVLHNLVLGQVTVYGKNMLPTQTKKCHIFEIFHRTCSILTTFYKFQRIFKFYLGKKFPKFATFFGLVPRNLTVRVLVYDKLFILCWRIYHMLRDSNITVRKFFHRTCTYHYQKQMQIYKGHGEFYAF